MQQSFETAFFRLYICFLRENKERVASPRRNSQEVPQLRPAGANHDHSTNSTRARGSLRA